ncbi:uncharacterized protein PHACADRAFT_196266 [Phanerochaete carnosa HHB-10118-sp]|uniref:Uncharacterized protein n=1 Tax=Phanerochaete carnosa (strain HHB-10118-sp) TaxID=650164 RepID=K5V143_PHACS|nr:uncharacterized protein PHACADRAFT_196266 [Phanerochaete carnosa HHB-10118-sp]EKM56206.1 hypothetical protein PHACADRAFT_196266 [Phanerochaete carnosa HHB-10118-sp]
MLRQASLIVTQWELKLRPTARPTKPVRWTKSTPCLHISAADAGETQDVQKSPDLVPPARREAQGEDQEDLDEAFDIHEFDHPNTYEHQGTRSNFVGGRAPRGAYQGQR